MIKLTKLRLSCSLVVYAEDALCMCCFHFEHTRDTFCPTNQPHSAQSNCERKVERSAFPATSPRVLSLSPKTHTVTQIHRHTYTHLQTYIFLYGVSFCECTGDFFIRQFNRPHISSYAYYSAHRDNRRACEDSHQHHPQSLLLAFHSFYSTPCAVFVVLSNMSSKCVLGVLFKQTEKSPYSGCQIMF